MYQELLEKVGLTKGEASVYLALLQTGSVTVGPIVNKSGVAYSNVYTILERLLEKGLVSFVIKAKTKYFQAVEPNRVLDFVEKQKKELEEQKEALEKAIPKLAALQKMAGEKQEAEVFIGWKGLKTAYEKMLEYYTGQEPCYFFYSYFPEHAETANNFFNQFHELYKTKKIHFFGISNEEYRSSWYVKKAKAYAEMKYVSFPLPSNIDILGDAILINPWAKTPLCFIIHSKEIANDFKKYFKMLWGAAKS